MRTKSNVVFQHEPTDYAILQIGRLKYLYRLIQNSNNDSFRIIFILASRNWFTSNTDRPRLSRPSCAHTRALKCRAHTVGLTQIFVKWSNPTDFVWFARYFRFHLFIFFQRKITQVHLHLVCFWFRLWFHLFISFLALPCWCKQKLKWFLLYKSLFLFWQRWFVWTGTHIRFTFRSRSILRAQVKVWEFIWMTISMETIIIDRM